MRVVFIDVPGSGASGSVIMIAMVMLGVMFTASVLDATAEACFACPTSLRFPPRPVNLVRVKGPERAEQGDLLFL
jgi:hypothetical protein